MAKRTFVAGATSQTIDVFIADSSSVVGAGLSGLAFGTSGLKAYYRKGATGAATAITLVTQTVVGAWSSGGFVEIDATNMKGVYRLDVPDTVFAASPYAVVYLYGATNMVPCVAELEIVAYNPFNLATFSNSLADYFLDRDMAVGVDSGSPTVRTVRQALRFLRNKKSYPANVLTVTKEDDATASWTATVTTDVDALPIIGVDPA